MVYISFSNVNQTMSSVIHFRPQLRNGVTFELDLHADLG